MKQSWLARLLKLESVDTDRRYCFEPLERRELMAADLGLLETAPLFEDTSSDSAFFSTTNSELSTLSGEGEAAPDLVAFATLLRDAGVIFFGAAWCPVCSEQKRLFEDGAPFLDFIEVTNPDRTLNQRGTDEGISTFPTWQFQGGSRQEGILTLEQISTLSGIAIPTSSAPFLNAIADQTVEINSPLHIPVDAYDPNGNAMTVSVTSSNPTVIAAEVVQGGRSARVATNFGDMTFRLFELEAPRPTARFIELAQSGFYNTTGTSNMTFHRVDDGFVIQGGDPLGTGQGGSQLGDFDDQFNINLQHNRSGVLSYAKSTDDTNDSQFFVTEVATRFLNSNHSVFGQLVEGEAVREAISGTSVNSSDRPIDPVIIQSVTIFDDIENGLIRLRSTGTAGQTSLITVTVTDSEGNSTSRTFTATVANKLSNDAPFLNDFDDTLSTVEGQPVTVQLTSQDAEGDSVQYFIPPVSANFQNQAQASVNATTGLVTITPPTGFVGTFNVLVGVRANSAAAATDTQTISITVDEAGPSAPTSIDLTAESDTGVSPTDNITNASSMTFNLSGTISGATVELLNGTTVVGTATATGTTTSITTTSLSGSGSGTFTLTARQTVAGETSGLSPSFAVTFDNVVPATITSSVFPESVQVGDTVSLNLQHAEEGAGLRYALVSPPAGASIDAVTGVFTWTPILSQVGAQAFTLRLTDAAGNVQSQTINIDVVEPALGSISVRFTDVNGNAITEVGIGQTFRVQLVAEDLREQDIDGVFSAFVDLLYNSSLVQLEGTDPISFKNGFTLATSGITTTLGLIDELGGSRSSAEISGPAPIVFVEVTMRSLASGQAIFTSEPADDVGSDFALYSREGAVPTAQINFNSATLSIGRNFDANNDTFTVNEDSTSNALNVLANDTFRTGFSGSLTLVSAGSTSAGGTVSVSGSSVLYTPAANFFGTETFTYVVRDSNGAEDTATVTVTVQDINDPPIASPDTLTVDQGSTQNVLSVLANDSIGADQGETLTITSIGILSAGGTATIGSGGTTIVYTPLSTYSGVETFTYTISDGRGGTATSTVTVNVAPAVPPPTAVSDAFTVVEDAASASFDVLANDIPSETGETLSIVGVTATNGGVVSVSSDGLRINYRPALNFAGTETVTYTLRGSLGGQTFGTAVFTVTPVNDPPTAVDDTFTVLSSQPNQVVNVLANDSTVDAGEVLTIASVSSLPAGQGTVTISSDGKSLLYNAPNTDFEGTVTFTYTLSDGSSLTDTATVILTVRNFVPRDIGGKLFSSNGSSNLLSGITVQVSGTALTGETISRSVVTDATGSFLAEELPPGDYTFTVPQLAFRTGSAGSMTVSSAAEDGDSTANVLNVGSVAPVYVDVRDFLGSSTGRGLGIAAQIGSTQQWLAASGAWRGYKAITATLNAAGTSLTIQVTRANNATQSVNVNLANNDLVQVRATEGNVKYIRIVGEPIDFNLPVPTASEIAANNVAVASLSQSAAFSTLGQQAATAQANDLALQNLGELSAEGEDASSDQMDEYLDVAALLTPQI